MTMGGAMQDALAGAWAEAPKRMDAHCWDKGTQHRGNTAEVRDAAVKRWSATSGKAAGERHQPVMQAKLFLSAGIQSCPALP